jgi:hypothetical protein
LNGYDSGGACLEAAPLFVVELAVLSGKRKVKVNEERINIRGIYWGWNVIVR